jgi:hypothetical protein
MGRLSVFELVTADGTAFGIKQVVSSMGNVA